MMSLPRIVVLFDNVYRERRSTTIDRVVSNLIFSCSSKKKMYTFIERYSHATSYVVTCDSFHNFNKDGDMVSI